MPRHVIGVNGGLGNQLFQYSFGEWLRRETGLRVVYDLSAFRRSERKFELDALGLPNLARGTRVTLCLPHPQGRGAKPGIQIRQLLGPPLVQLESPESESTRADYRPSWWYGYWQRSLYANVGLEILRETVRPLIQPVSAIGIHVRKTDYRGNGLELSENDYERLLVAARARVGTTVPVHIYSDDLEWCRRHLRFASEADFRTTGSAIGDLLALAACSCLILSRSTFSWWAAHIGDRDPGLVFAASPFFVGDMAKDRDLVDERWNRVVLLTAGETHGGADPSE